MQFASSMGNKEKYYFLYHRIDGQAELLLFRWRRQAVYGGLEAQGYIPWDDGFQIKTGEYNLKKIT